MGCNPRQVRGTRFNSGLTAAEWQPQLIGKAGSSGPTSETDWRQPKGNRKPPSFP